MKRKNNAPEREPGKHLPKKEREVEQLKREIADLQAYYKKAKEQDFWYKLYTTMMATYMCQLRTHGILLDIINRRIEGEHWKPEVRNMLNEINLELCKN